MIEGKTPRHWVKTEMQLENLGQMEKESRETVPESALGAMTLWWGPVDRKADAHAVAGECVAVVVICAQVLSAEVTVANSPEMNLARHQTEPSEWWSRWRDAFPVLGADPQPLGMNLCHVVAGRDLAFAAIVHCGASLHLYSGDHLGAG